MSAPAMESPNVEADSNSNSNVLPNCVDNLKKLSWMKIVHELYIYGAKTQDLPFSRGLSKNDKLVRIVLTLDNKGHWESLLRDTIVIQKLFVSDCTQALFKSYILPKLDLSLLQELEIQRCKFEKDSISKLMMSRNLRKVSILNSQMNIIKLNQILSLTAYVRNVVLDFNGIPMKETPKVIHCLKNWKRYCGLDSLTLKSFSSSVSSKAFAKILNRIFSIEGKLILEFRRNRTGLIKKEDSEEIWLKEIRKKQKIYLKKEKYEGLASLEIEVVKPHESSVET